jgi:hypothetical protein
LTAQTIIPTKTKTAAINGQQSIVPRSLLHFNPPQQLNSRRFLSRIPPTLFNPIPTTSKHPAQAHRNLEFSNLHTSQKPKNIIASLGLSDPSKPTDRSSRSLIPLRVRFLDAYWGGFGQIGQPQVNGAHHKGKIKTGFCRSPNSDFFRKRGPLWLRLTDPPQSAPNPSNPRPKSVRVEECQRPRSKSGIQKLGEPA